jgi:uncharacterized membrane protein YhaH (DUF805 family)
MDWRSFFFSFRGRINQAKYWLALLIFTIVGMVQGLVGFALGNAVLFQIFNFLIDLAVLVASIAVGIKRLHDRDRSAWWLLLFYLGPVVFAGAGGAIMWAGASSVGMTEDWSLFPRLCLLGGFARSASGVWSRSVSCAGARATIASGRIRSESTKAGLDLRPNRKPFRKSGEENGRGASGAQAGRNLQYAP